MCITPLPPGQNESLLRPFHRSAPHSIINVQCVNLCDNFECVCVCVWRCVCQVKFKFKKLVYVFGLFDFVPFQVLLTNEFKTELD